MAEAPGKERLSLSYYETVLFEYDHLILDTGKVEFKTDPGAPKQRVAMV